MASTRAPKGLLVELITPLHGDGSVDGEGLVRLLEQVIPHTQAVFLASPGAGEGKHLNTTLRTDLLSQALSVIQGRIPVLMWITRHSAKETEATLRALEADPNNRRHMGPVFWVDTPIFYHSNRGLPAHYGRLGALTRSPFILYNDPELIRPLSRRFRRSNIRTHILKDLSSLENLTGLIFRGSLDRAHNYQRACRKRTDFRIYDGDERDFLDHPSMSGVTSVGANLAPRAWEKVIRSSLHLQGTSAVYPDSLRQMWKLGQHLRDLMDLYEQEPAAVVKGVLWKAGLIETPLCFSAKPDVREEVDRIEEVLAAADTHQP